jgi:hypothetical protein
VCAVAGHFTFDPSIFPSFRNKDAASAGVVSSALANSSAFGPLSRELQRTAETFWADNAGRNEEERTLNRAVNRFRNNFTRAWNRYGALQGHDALERYGDFSNAIDKSREGILASTAGPTRDTVRPILDRLHFEAMQIGLAHWDQQNRAVNPPRQSVHPDAVISGPSSAPPNAFGGEPGRIPRIGEPFGLSFGPQSADSPSPSLPRVPSDDDSATSSSGNTIAVAPAATAGPVRDSLWEGITKGLPAGLVAGINISQSEWFQRNRKAVVDHLHTKLTDEPILFSTPGLLPGTFEWHYRQPELGDVYAFGVGVLSATLPLAGTFLKSASVVTKAASATAQVGNLSKLAAQFGANKLNGAAFELFMARRLATSGIPQGPQVTVRTSQTGIRGRPDFLTRDACGTIGVIECKSSATARLTARQKKFYDALGKEGGVVVGKGKPGFEGGTQIPPPKVQIIRPTELDLP